MADSTHYTTFNLSRATIQSGTEGSEPFTIMDTASTWVAGLGIGWSILHKTGNAEVDFETINTSDKARVVYLEYDDGTVGNEYGKNIYHYFWATLKYVQVGSVTPYTWFTNGALRHPYQSGVTHKLQTGWDGEAVTSPLFFGNQDSITVHAFAGVENGAPYFYTVIESRTTTWKTYDYYCHLGFGVLNKLGSYYGGQFMAGNCAVDLDAPSAGTEGRMFDNGGSFTPTSGLGSTCPSGYRVGSSGRSRVWYSPSTNIAVVPTSYEYGIGGAASTPLRAYGDFYSSFSSAPLFSYLTGKGQLYPLIQRISKPGIPSPYTAQYIILGSVPGLRRASNQWGQDKKIYTDHRGAKWKILAYRSRNPTTELNQYHSDSTSLAYRIP